MIVSRVRRICLKTAMTFARLEELLEHRDVKTTMVYTHVLNSGGKSTRNPVDML